MPQDKHNHIHCSLPHYSLLIMPQYAYIPLAQAPSLPDLEGYRVRLAVYVPGFATDLVDSNGNGIPNILELDVPEFTQQQETDIYALGGERFPDAETYLAWKDSLVSP
jgi:hypothetical protein